MSRRVEHYVVGVAVAVLVVGLALSIVTMPWFTSLLVDRVDSASNAGLKESQTLLLAEQVRSYVTHRDAPQLPSHAYGRAAFDAAQVSHLDDVRDVMLAARNATGVAFAAVALWLAWSSVRHRRDAVAATLKVAGVFLVGLPVVLIAVALLDFETVFARFHQLFFEAGTWTFGWDDLVIQLFPERFWMWAAGAWGGVIVAAGTALLAVSRFLGPGESRQDLR